MIKRSLAAVFIVLASSAASDPLPEMAGAWSGSGWARQSPGAAKETLRCRLRNSYNAAKRRLDIEGQCAVPGKRLEIGGALIMGNEGRLSGHWRNPDGPGRTSISGQTQGDAVYFTFRANEPGTGLDISQIITWRVSDDALSLRAVTRSDRQEMSIIEFSR